MGLRGLDLGVSMGLAGAAVSASTPLDPMTIIDHMLAGVSVRDVCLYSYLEAKQDVCHTV